MTLKILFSLLVSTAAFAQNPLNSYEFSDGSYICLQPSAPEDLEIHVGGPFDESIAVSCQKLNGLRAFLNYTAVSMTATGIYLACTGVGVPVSVQVEAVGVGAQVLSLLLGHITCEDRETEKALEEKIIKKTCSVMKANGLRCDPRKMRLLTEKPVK